MNIYKVFAYGHGLMREDLHVECCVEAQDPMAAHAEFRHNFWPFPVEPRDIKIQLVPSLEQHFGSQSCKLSAVPST